MIPLVDGRLFQNIPCCDSLSFPVAAFNIFALPSAWPPHPHMPERSGPLPSSGLWRKSRRPCCAAAWPFEPFSLLLPVRLPGRRFFPLVLGKGSPYPLQHTMPACPCLSGIPMPQPACELSYATHLPCPPPLPDPAAPCPSGLRKDCPPRRKPPWTPCLWNGTSTP